MALRTLRKGSYKVVWEDTKGKVRCGTTTGKNIKSARRNASIKYKCKKIIYLQPE